MAKTALLTLGRLPKALDIARALKGSGCRVVIAEPFGTHLCRPSRSVDACRRVTSPVDDEGQYLNDMLRVIEAEGVDLVVPVSEEALYAAALKDRLPTGVRYFGVDRPLLRSLYDKRSFIERAAAMDLAVPETTLLGTPQADALSKRTDVVLKRVYSSAGVGVEFVDRGGALPPSEASPTLVQARLPGRHRNTLSLAHEGRVIGTSAYEGTVMSHTVAVAFRRIAAPDLEAWIARFVAETGYSGFIAFDFIDDDHGVAHAIECNPRANSGIHFFDPKSLAAAILTPGATRSIGFRNQQKLQQFFPTLTETQSAVFKPKLYRQNAGYLWTSKDVSWSWRDPLPFILMTFTSWAILKRALFKGESFGEAAVSDIAWSGPSAAPQTPDEDLSVTRHST